MGGWNHQPGLYIYIFFFSFWIYCIYIYSVSLCTGVFSTYFFWTAPTTSGWCWYQNYPDGQKWNGKIDDFCCGVNCIWVSPIAPLPIPPFFHALVNEGPLFIVVLLSEPPLWISHSEDVTSHKSIKCFQVESWFPKESQGKTNQATFSSHFCFNLVDIPSSSNLAHFIFSITMTQQALGFARS